MSETLAEKEARIDAGETFGALRRAGKINIAPPARGEGVDRLDNVYPYVAKRLMGLAGTEGLPTTTLTRGGISIPGVPVMPDAKTEREFMARNRFIRE